MKRTDPFYLSREWRAYSDAMLARKPLCAYCGVAYASLIDHVLPIRTHPELRLTRSNTVPSCLRCSNRLTTMFDLPRSPMIYTPDSACDADGNPTDPLHPWNGYTGPMPTSKRELLDILRSLRRPPASPLIAADGRHGKAKVKREQRQRAMSGWKPVC